MKKLFTAIRYVAVPTMLAALSMDVSATWIKFGENDRLVSYYEPAKPVNSTSAVVWVMYDYKTEQESQRSGRKYFSQKGQQEVDCEMQRGRTIFFTWHAGRMGDGPVV